MINRETPIARARQNAIAQISTERRKSAVIRGRGGETGRTPGSRPKLELNALRSFTGLATLVKRLLAVGREMEGKYPGATHRGVNRGRSLLGLLPEIIYWEKGTRDS